MTIISNSIAILHCRRPKEEKTGGTAGWIWREMLIADLSCLATGYSLYSEESTVTTLIVLDLYQAAGLRPSELRGMYPINARVIVASSPKRISVSRYSNKSYSANQCKIQMTGFSAL